MSDPQAGGETRAETRRERVAYGAFATVAWLGRTLPTHTGRMLFTWAGTALFHLMPGLRAVVAANQGRVLGRDPQDPLVRACTREAFRRYARYWFDAFDVVDWSDEQIGRAYVFEGYERMQAAVAKGDGVIAVLPHMGNWDAAGRALQARGLPVVSVAENLRPHRLFELFLRHRESLGMQIIGLGEGTVGRQLAKVLSEGRLVALVADRDLTGRGVEVQMFGGTRRLPAGPALLAISSGASVLVASIYQTSTGWRCVLEDLPEVPRTGDRRADVIALTQAIAVAFEKVISASPADWHLFQAGWDT
ncbi:MAG: phosphatidylinositol mannoside acyltransferase [Actinomycetota bacterium]